MNSNILQTSKILKTSLIRSDPVQISNNLTMVPETVKMNLKKFLEAPNNKRKKKEEIEEQTSFIHSELQRNDDTKEEMLEYLNKKSREFNPKKIKMLEFLGQGGYGKVYKAFDEDRLKFLAIKDIINAQNLSPEELKSIIHENKVLRAIKNLKDPRYLKFYHIYKRIMNNVPIYCLVMESGVADLKKICSLRKNNANEYSQQEYTYILYCLCKQFDKLERHGISHRDVKPCNIILTENEPGKYVYKIIDFGIGHVNDNTDEKLIPIISVKGWSPKYVSPEVKKYADKEVYNPYLADVYSLAKSFIDVMTSPCLNFEEKLINIEKKFKKLAKILKTMISEKPSKRPAFSELRKELKNHKKCMPDEKNYVELVNKNLMEENNNLQQVLNKMTMFFDFNFNMSLKYANFAQQIFENEKKNMNDDDQIDFYNQMSLFYTLNCNYQQSLKFIEFVKNLELKNNEKISPETLKLLLFIQIHNGLIEETIELLENSKDIDFNIEDKIMILDSIFPQCFALNLDLAIQMNEESLALKKKMKNNQKFSDFLINYLFRAYFGILKGETNTKLITKITKHVIKLKKSSHNYLFYAFSSIYYLIIYISASEEKDLDIEKIFEIIKDLVDDIKNCITIMGDEHCTTKCLKFLQKILTNQANENDLSYYVNEMQNNFPCMKKMINKNDEEKTYSKSLENLKTILMENPKECKKCKKETSDSMKLICNHVFCLKCLKDHISISIQNINNELFYPLCPELNCGSPISEYQMKLMFSPETYKKFKNLIQSNFGEEMFIICPNCHTSYFLPNDANSFVCEICKICSCATCLRNVKNHKGITCKEYQDQL